LGADFLFFFTNHIGVGIKYNAILVHAFPNDISYTFADGTIKKDHLSELVEIHYLGTLLATEFFTIPQKQCFFANVGIGYIRYTHNAKLIKLGYELTNIAKNSAAFFAEIGYDFFVSKYVAIWLQASMLIELKKGKLTEPENMSHIDISLGFRFYNL
jgi:hypothetical protein